MLSLRPVGTLAVKCTGKRSPLSLPHPSEAAVVVVGGLRASEHDSFSGAVNVRIDTLGRPRDVGHMTSSGGTGGRIDHGDAPVVATMVAGEGGKTFLVQYLQRQSCLSVADVRRGLHRGFVPLRLVPARGSTKGISTTVECIAGSKTPGSGLVFLGRSGISALQVVRVDPWDGHGSISQTLGPDSGSVMALSCHPSRPIVAACLGNGTIELWDYQGVCAGQGGGGRLSAGSAAGVDLATIGGSDGYLGASGVASPPSSPSRTRSAGKGSKDDKLPVKPRLEGRLYRIATLSIQGTPWISISSPREATLEAFRSVAFHQAREWLCACSQKGVVAVWNLDGVITGRPRTMTSSTSRPVSMEILGESADGLVAGLRAAGAFGPVRPFAARRLSDIANMSNIPRDGSSLGDVASSISALGNGGLSGNSDGSLQAMGIAFLPSEPVILVGLTSASSTAAGAKGSPRVSTTGGAGGNNDDNNTTTAGTSAAKSKSMAKYTNNRLVLLSLLDATMPVLYSVMSPHAIVNLCVEPRSGRVFATRATSSVNARPMAIAAGSMPGAWGGDPGIGSSSHGFVSVLALGSGHFLDRGSFRILNTTMEVPPSVFLEGVVDSAGVGNDQETRQPLLPLPLQVYFLRSMAVLIQAGPGGGVDVPAVKAVLHAQGLERDKGLKDRSKPRRLASLPGHTDDLLRHTRSGDSVGFPAGHLIPYRLVPGPLLKLTGGAREERRRFLVLYEIVASEGSDRPPPASRDAALTETSRTVCGLVTPAGYSEAHGRYENEAQLSHLFPATDGCFVSVSGGGEPNALLVEGGGYLMAVYTIPDMQLLGRKALSLPVTRVVATPECLGSQRGKAWGANNGERGTELGKLALRLYGEFDADSPIIRQVLYVVRSPQPPSGFLETLVYSDRGGLQCPEPLLPIGPQTLVVGGTGGNTNESSTWSSGRPYANAHFVLDNWERVVDVKFQSLTTVAELSTWGYRRGVQAGSAAVPMVAVLTTRRVLMLSAARLTPLAEAWGHPPNSRAALNTSGGLSVAVVSISWAGSSVLCALEDGRIVYLNPGDGMLGLCTEESEAGFPDGGSAVAASPWRPLCSLDRRLCTGGVGIAACLPDRLCLIVRGGMGGGIAHLVTRPFFPLESLVSGVLAASRSHPPSHHGTASTRNGRGTSIGEETLIHVGNDMESVDAVTLAVLRRLVARYSPPRARLPAGTSQGDGPGLGAGATCAVFRLLSRYGLHVLAAEVAGVDNKGEGEGMEVRSADVFMRRRPWISPTERSRCAMLLGFPMTAMVEGIGDDPALVDNLADPDAMTSALLPALGSRLSRVAASLAKQSEHLGLHDYAARLHDLSGDDYRLISFLSALAQGQRHPYGNVDIASTADAAAQQLRALQSSGTSAMGERVSNGEDDGPTGKFFRRSSLLAGVSRIPQASSLGLQGHALESAGGGEEWNVLVDGARNRGPAGGSRGGGRGGGEPPASSLRPLALHCGEQWTGRLRPECLEVNVGGGLGVTFNPVPQDPLSRSASGSSPTPYKQAPSPVLSLDAGLGGVTMGDAAMMRAGGEAGTLVSGNMGPAEITAAGVGVDAFAGAGGLIQKREEWVAVGGSWRDEENVCGYWRFSDGAAAVSALTEASDSNEVLPAGKQVEIKDLSKYGSTGLACGEGLWFEDTTSPVDPGEKGKVAEAIDVCFPRQVSTSSPSAGNSIGGYGRGIFVKAVRGSSIDIGPFHDEQKRSVATVEMWVNAANAGGDESKTLLSFERSTDGEGETIASRRFQQAYHVLACRVSASGEHVWSLVVENNGQVAFIPGPSGRRHLGEGYALQGSVGGDRDDQNSKKIKALKEAVYTESGAFSWARWTHVALAIDTSRDESTAEVRLFLDGYRKAAGTCRFNKVNQSCLWKTWMILGPDLIGWRLTEARLWAMLRDEEALQDWRHNSLALAETKKARLVIRAVSKAKPSSAALQAPSDASPVKPPGKLTPPPGSSTGGSAAARRLLGTIAPPPGSTSVAALASLPPPPRKETDSETTPPGDTRKGLQSLRTVGSLRNVAGASTRDPRKAALAANRRQGTVSGGLVTPTRSFVAAPPPVVQGPSDTSGFFSSSPQAPSPASTSSPLPLRSASPSSVDVLPSLGMDDMGTGLGRGMGGKAGAEAASPSVGSSPTDGKVGLGSAATAVSIAAASPVPSTGSTPTTAWSAFGEDLHAAQTGMTGVTIARAGVVGWDDGRGTGGDAPRWEPSFTVDDGKSMVQKEPNTAFGIFGNSTTGTNTAGTSSTKSSGEVPTMATAGKAERTSGWEALFESAGNDGAVKAPGGDITETKAIEPSAKGATVATVTTVPKRDNTSEWDAAFGTIDSDRALKSMGNNAIGPSAPDASAANSSTKISMTVIGTSPDKPNWEASLKNAGQDEAVKVQSTDSNEASISDDGAGRVAPPAAALGPHSSEWEASFETMPGGSAANGGSNDAGGSAVGFCATDANSAKPTGAAIRKGDGTPECEALFEDVDDRSALEAQGTTPSVPNDGLAIHMVSATTTVQHTSKSIVEDQAAVFPVMSGMRSHGYIATGRNSVMVNEASVADVDSTKTTESMLGSIMSGLEVPLSGASQEEPSGTDSTVLIIPTKVEGGAISQVSTSGLVDVDGKVPELTSRVLASDLRTSQINESVRNSISGQNGSEASETLVVESARGTRSSGDVNYTAENDATSTKTSRRALSEPDSHDDGSETTCTISIRPTSAEGIVELPSAFIGTMGFRPGFAEEAYTEMARHETTDTPQDTSNGSTISLPTGGNSWAVRSPTQEVIDITLGNELATEPMMSSAIGGAAGGNGEHLQRKDVSLDHADNDEFVSGGPSGSSSPSRMTTRYRPEQSAEQQAAIISVLGTSSAEMVRSRSFSATNSDWSPLDAPSSGTGGQSGRGERRSYWDGAGYFSDVVEAPSPKANQARGDQDPPPILPQPMRPVQAQRTRESQQQQQSRRFLTLCNHTSLSENMEAEAGSEAGLEAGQDVQLPGGGIPKGIEVVWHTAVVAGGEAALTTAEATSGHLIGPLLASNPTCLAVGSCDNGTRVAIVDLGDGAKVTSYPISCTSAIFSPRTDEQVVALLGAEGLQVFSVTNRIRRRHVPAESLELMFWRWLSSDVIAIVTATAIFYWDVRGTGVPMKVFERRRPRLPSDPPTYRSCGYSFTPDARWGLLAVADKEVICNSCQDESAGGACTCETSLLLDLHDLHSGDTLYFRALGAALLDVSSSPDAQGVARKEALLAAIVPNDEGNVLRLMRLAPAPQGGNPVEDVQDECLSLCLLPPNASPSGEGREDQGDGHLRKHLRKLGIPAVPYLIISWQAAAGMELLVVLGLNGSLTVLRIEAGAAALSTMLHDDKAFPPVVIGAAIDSKKDLVVLSALSKDDESWVISRARLVHEQTEEG